MPLFLHEIFTFSPRSTSMSLIIPKPNINLAKSNFAFQGSSIWNALVKTTMNKCNPNSKGIMIPGSAHGSNRFRPVILKNTILQELKGKAMTLPDILRVGLGPCVQRCPSEALEQKLGPKLKSKPTEIELCFCHHLICLEKTSNLIKITSKSDEKNRSYAQ